jgi:hypothetical protein
MATVYSVEITQEAFWEIDTIEGQTFIPADCFEYGHAIEKTLARAGRNPGIDQNVSVTYHVNAWFCRLSASGYLDCTEWNGPFDSEEEARAYLEEAYGDDATPP